MGFSKALAALFSAWLAGAVVAASASDDFRPDYQALQQDLSKVEEMVESGYFADVQTKVPERYLEMARPAAIATRAHVDRQLRDQLADHPEGEAAALAELAADADTDPEPEWVVFVSWGMPQTALRQAFIDAGRYDAAVVVRGLIPGSQNLMETVRSMHETVSDITPRPDVFIDPPAFKRYGVNVVPTVVRRDRSGNVTARAEGIVNLEWIEETASSENRDLGKQGDVYEIAEVDLIEMMQARAANLDSEALIEKAKQSFWEGKSFRDYPTARVADRRIIDPTIEVTADIEIGHQKYVARAGDRYNPFEVAPFTRRVYVFDGRQPKQVAAVRNHWAALAGIERRTPVFITTAIDTERGWDHMADLEEEFQSPIFLLQPEIAAMMRLRALPTVMHAEDQMMVLDEIGIPESDSDNPMTGMLDQLINYAQQATNAVADTVIGTAHAQSVPGGLEDSVCPTVNILGSKLIEDICWDCMFPIRALSGTAGDPEDAPTTANDDTICFCEDSFGVPELGFTIGMWQITRIIEITKIPYCAPAFGGKLFSSWRLLGSSHGPDLAKDNGSFHNVHIYSFPLMSMLELLEIPGCAATAIVDFDLINLTEYDPTWSDPELSMMAVPEAALFGNPAAQLAQSYDCAASTLGRPVDATFWTAGCWGSLYPLNGYYHMTDSTMKLKSMIATRVMALQHRRGFARRTAGYDTLCTPKYYPQVKKSQYKMQLFHPIPENQSPGGVPATFAEGPTTSPSGTTVEGGDEYREPDAGQANDIASNTGSLMDSYRNQGREKCCHSIGQHTYTWGESRNKIASDNTLMVLWQWIDCCAR